MGSKNRIAKHILPIMLAEREDNQYWVEPFVGGANLIDKVDGKRIGNDSHFYLIELLKAVQDGWKPPTEVTQEQYYAIKNEPEKYKACLVGFVGFLCSFGGRWWEGFARDTKKNRNYALEGCNNLLKQAKHLQGIQFVNGNYLDLEIPPRSLIYCDAPYQDTTHYKDKIDYSIFWQWCRDKSNEGHTVFISEYNAPDDFDCVLTLNHQSMLNRSKKVTRVEKLFRYRKK